MIADNDHVVGLSVESFKDESKPHKCPEEIREDAELRIPKNKNNVCELFYDTRSGDALKHHYCGDSDEAGKMIRGKSQDTAAKGGLFYMDKNVTACDSPEIVVCYKESAYHVVKDICVDEGVPVHEKFLFGEKDSVRCNSEDLVETKSPEDRNGKLDGSELCNDSKTNQDVEEFSREGLADAEGSRSCNQEDLIVTKEAKEVQVASTSENVLTLGSIILSSEDEQKPLNNSHRSEEQSPSQLQAIYISSFENEQRSLETEEPRKAEEKLSSVSIATSHEPERPGTDQQQPDSFEDGKLFSSGFGETSFSAAEAVSISGHISYSGPVVVSGRLSVRSDASTTSGRSFAFPILQSEWNSSPERMAKAEKRRLKGWREILLCCRFS
ncbi:hypothetical protein Bca101_030948 [Brassica carinata]